MVKTYKIGPIQTSATWVDAWRTADGVAARAWNNALVRCADASIACKCRSCAAYAQAELRAQNAWDDLTETEQARITG